MLVFAAVSSAPDHPTQLQARVLFSRYADFLRATLACGVFDFDRFAHETDTLPMPYTGRHGEVLLAVREGVPAGCIAFRATAHDPATAEIKRLFVLPECRGHGIARQLIAQALECVRIRSFRRVILDTHINNMPRAHSLYLRFGFVEYARNEQQIAFLELPIT
jgi:GNAT superfamily N-acetyltransferase